MRPVTLLLTLLLGAALAGSFAYSNYLRANLAGQSAETSPTAAAAAPVPDATASESLNKKIKFLEDQIALLKKENESLAKSVQTLSQAATTRAERTAPPPASGGIESLVREVEQIRELNFKKPIVFVRVPPAEIEKRIRDSIEASIPPEVARAKERSAVVLGFAGAAFNWIDALTGLTNEQSGGHYDRSTGQLFIDETADFESRPDLKGKLVKELAVALLDQHFGEAAAGGPDGSGNDDATLARRALFIGDAVSTKIHYGVVDALNNDYSRAQQPAAQTQFTGAPQFLREQFLFPYMMASDFSQQVRPDESTPRDAVFARPPQSTAEVLHPELYTRTPPFVPAVITWSDTAVAGNSPFNQNTVGEFGIYLLFKSHLGEDVAFDASVGWLGDRYLCYPGDEKNGDQFFWITRWEKESDALEFAKAAQTVLLHRFAIPWHKRYQHEDGSFIVNDPYRVLRFRLTADKKGVTIVNAVRADFADAMETRFIQ